MRRFFVDPEHSAILVMSFLRPGRIPPWRLIFQMDNMYVGSESPLSLPRCDRLTIRISENTQGRGRQVGGELDPK